MEKKKRKEKKKDMTMERKQTSKQRATLQPKVPAPKRRHFVAAILSKSSEGRSLHLINFKFKSTAVEASLLF